MSRAQNEYVPVLYEPVFTIGEPVFTLDEHVFGLDEHVLSANEHVTTVSPHNGNVHRAAAKVMQAEKAARPAAPCATYCYRAVTVDVESCVQLSAHFVADGFHSP